MESKEYPMDVFIGEPAADSGENRYLTHFTSEIILKGEVSGFILFTRYDYLEAEQDQIPFRWLVQPHSYMSTVSSLIVGTQTRFPTLPLEIQENILDKHGHVYILDEVTCTNYHKDRDSFIPVIHQLLSYLRDRTDAVLVSDGESFGRYLSNKEEAPIDFWRQFGILNISGKYLYSKTVCELTSDVYLEMFPEPF